MTIDTAPFAEKLSQFGLTETDSSIYLFLLERGVPFGGSKIAAGLSIHRQYVYNSLQKLIHLQLVELVGKEPRPKYQALSPQQLTHLARQRLQDAQSTARELDKLSAVGADQDFDIYRGAQQIFDFEEEFVHSLPEGQTQYIIGGGAQNFINFYGDRYEQISGVAKAKGLKTKYVGCPDEEPWLKRAEAAVGNFETRTLPHMPQTTAQTVIRLNSVTFYSFGTPPLVYIIKSKAVYEDYKKFFEMLWGMAV